MEYVEYDGIKWRKDSRGYYVYAHKNKSHLLHRYVWERERGSIPNGMHVHHLYEDDRHTTDITRLQLLTHVEHWRIHTGPKGGRTTWEQREWYDVECQICGKSVRSRGMSRPRTCGSTRCVELLAKHEQWPSRVWIERMCDVCGERFDSPARNNTRTCSTACRAVVVARTRIERHGRRKVQEDRRCVICESDFTVNSYRPRETCGGSCAKRLADRRRGLHVRSDGRI